MMPRLNPKDIEKVMRQMGIKQEDIPATEVVIKCDDKEIVITSPQVAKVVFSGQETYQITGTSHVRGRDVPIGEEDIRMVMEQTGASHDAAEAALKTAKGDLAGAILELKK